jgi:hypothetical protein
LHSCLSCSALTWQEPSLVSDKSRAGWCQQLVSWHYACCAPAQCCRCLCRCKWLKAAPAVGRTGHSLVRG